MIRRPPRSTHCISSAASDVYKRQIHGQDEGAVTGTGAVSYTHLTLPTICSVQISVVAVSLKKKKKKKNSETNAKKKVKCEPRQHNRKTTKSKQSLNQRL
eukprot:TRINITY_DN2013_c0_g1_i1.p2 TRINITY_DN2013_c0_g1~~TRINITY_DN2013_c0_g1_i1.p2  ORF type:complete len:100 (+),score=35.61 TRINITY_DN2013_c0_g1_i1:73-372(+)